MPHALTILDHDVGSSCWFTMYVVANTFIYICSSYLLNRESFHLVSIKHASRESLIVKYVPSGHSVSICLPIQRSRLFGAVRYVMVELSVSPLALLVM